MDERVLILAPRGRDAQVAQSVLAPAVSRCAVCPDVAGLAAALAEGAGAAVLTEEALAEGDAAGLLAWLAGQPSWSDFPFIVLSSKRTGRRTGPAAQRLADIGNVVLLERPINAETLLSAVQSALRARRRQYQAGQQLRELALAETQLRGLNETLEQRVDAATAELRQLNDRLRQEIAERERAEAVLVQMQKMEAIGHLTGGIAHDFNNLLTAILGNVEMIGRRSSDERVRRMAGYAREAVDRATRLTGQLLAFSRSQQLDLRPVGVDALVSGMDDLLARSLGHTIAIAFDLQAANRHATADANQLELAILNLAINARDAMQQGGTLTIATRVDCAKAEDLQPGCYVVISVADTGTGIPPDLLSKVFDPFFTTKSVGKGTGLGLSQVYGIARQCGGVARVGNRPGGGAVVEIWLPAAESAVSATAPVVSGDPARGHGEHVLVVDDDPDVRRFVVDGLQSLHYCVSQADGGVAGLERLAHDAPDLLIVDYAMAHVSGVDVAAAAHRLREGLPVILVTGYADGAALDRIAGTSLVLRKPFELAELASAIRRCLDAPAASRS